ncbi:Peptidyl-prolyl cis-trans isomerase cyp6 [Thoreauomyces humboldtii]|nr:Peptidyl-prolyl cis-trans isomerase cyp6 [Thoreauomyces humboldtii]
MSVLLETSLGEIVIDLEVEKAPKACTNFLKLCKIKAYNFVLFHNVQNNFTAQTGDPTGTGKGGESVWGAIHGTGRRYFNPEIHPKLKHRRKGTVSFATTASDESGTAVAGSQFFITLAENPLDYLDGKHAVFGRVVEGLDVLDKINAALADDEGRPYRDIRIKHTIVLDDPFDDPPNLPVPDRSPVPTEDMLKSGRIGEDEELVPDLPPEEYEKKQRQEEAAARALTLEMVGDLPFADIKPPENVLFVCKLNPVTRDEDLELIFSRFGTILSCEVLRDQKSGDSLCYAFVEFDNKDSCEEAYFKMDNVLIDDRRIHVDFSQSVSHLHHDFLRGKRPGAPDNSFGGSTELERRTRYRGQDARGVPEEDYDLVFEHAGNLDSEKKRGPPADGNTEVSAPLPSTASAIATSLSHHLQTNPSVETPPPTSSPQSEHEEGEWSEQTKVVDIETVSTPFQSYALRDRARSPPTPERIFGGTAGVGSETPVYVPKEEGEEGEDGVDGSGRPEQTLREVFDGFTGTMEITEFGSGEKIGQGTFGEVTIATHNPTGRKVALKRIILHKEKEGLPITSIREILILKALNHANIIAFDGMAFGKANEEDEYAPATLYMVFPYMHHDLFGLLKNPQVTLHPNQIKSFAKQLLEGLSYLHKNRLLHRDLKSANILIDNGGNLKIGDFGLARQRVLDSDKCSLTPTVVTLWYRPPEILLEERRYTSAVDMWGFGCIFAEMWDRTPIFQAATEPAAIDRIFGTCGTPRPGDWPEFQEICERQKIQLKADSNRRIRDMYRDRLDYHTITFIDTLLCLNPKKRLTAAQALQHSYFGVEPAPAEPDTTE